MKKIVASVGLVALGASSLYSAPIPGLTEEGGKNWSVAATLRGFYDDNLNTQPNGNKQDTFGLEVSPSLNYALQWQQTQISLGYVYSFKYYDHRPVGNGNDKYDQQHLFNAALDHAFTERYRLGVRDSFAIGQEPDVLRTENAFTAFQRISGDNVRNYGSIVFDAELTRLFGLEIGYDNAFFDYAQSGAQFDVDGVVIPSNSGLLDRIENGIHLDSRWMICPETVGVLGYKFRDVSYTADEEIGQVLLPGGIIHFIKSNERDFREHSFYAGAEQTFSPNLTGAVRAGVSYAEYYNRVPDSGSDWGPYALANLRYTYAPQSHVEVGLSQDFNATDVVGVRNTSGVDVTATSFTESQESTVVYATVNHQITPQLRGSLIGQFQYSSFNGGNVQDESDRYYLLGLNLSYQFTPHFSAEVGYNYDKLDSDIPGRTFDRNRVYIGVTGSY
jgi:predicted porin